MIKLKLSTFEGSSDKEIPIVSGETLRQCAIRVLESVPLENSIEDTFKILVNGYNISPEMWDSLNLKELDNVLICPIIKGGDNDGLMGQLFTIAAMAASVYFTGGLSATMTWSVWAVRIGTPIIAGYVASQLFPPPVLGGQGAFDGSILNDSQMYSLTSQSNAVKKFGHVPKVYGKHRMFPLVAATPYTELEIDRATGKKVQYLYAIYDFGFGPNIVSDIKIGDTPIANFEDAQYRIVDPLKPSVSEGVWDDESYTNFAFYKGDVTIDSSSVELNGNLSQGTSVNTIVREGIDNPNNYIQEITLTFVCPKGLFSSNSSGNKSYRSIDLDIQFAKKGTEDWKAYNDPLYTEGVRSVGGDSDTNDKGIKLYPWSGVPNALTTYYSLLYEGPRQVEIYRNDGIAAITKRPQVYGLSAGTYYIPVQDPSSYQVGESIKFNGVEIGTIASITNVLTGGVITLQSPLTNSISLFDVVEHEYQINWAEGPIPGSISAGFKYYDITGSVFERLFVKKVPLSRLVITATTQEAHYASVSFTPKQAGEYKVRIQRIRSRSQETSFKMDELSFVEFKTRFDTKPILSTKRHTFLEIRIKATGQLNGSLQNLSAVCTSVLDTWDGVQWVKSPTSNPAWVYVDLLTGQINKKPLSKSRLHLQSIKDWADYCQQVPVSGALYTFHEPRYQSNFVLDYNTTLQDIINKVTSSAQASINMVDGKYGVLLDINKTVPVQVFTPRNSSGFASSKTYTSRPHGLKVSYIDPNSNWQPNELVVYDDGYTKDNAEDFEEIQTFGCTQVEQAWRFGRYFIAQNKLRQETISIKVDFEHLVCTRGDYVKFVQDTMKVGGTPARVRTLVGNRITVDEGLITSGSLSYGFTFRSTTTGEIFTNTLSVVNSDTFDLDGPNLPQPGDLIIIGEVGFITYDCIVKSIVPQDNFSAVITLVEKAEALYTIESADSIPGYEPRLNVTTDANFSAPAKVENLEILENSYTINNSGYDYFVRVGWDSPSAGSSYELFEVYVDNGSGYNLVGTTKLNEYRYTVDSAKLGVLHNFKVLAVAPNGNKLGLGEVDFVSATPLAKSSKPSNVEVFNSDITGEVLQLFWTRVPDLDIKEYVIRFTPSVTGAWETSTILMRAPSTSSLVATQARTGTYLIKAVDFSNNESLAAASIITTIPNLFGLNVIDETTDFPPLLGTTDKVEPLGNSLVLSKAVLGPLGSEEYYTEGYYYFKDLLDMGEIYSARIQSVIEAEGLVATDIMANWPTLDSVALLYSPGSSSWDVEAQYRATNSLNVIADWTTLSSIGTMSQGSEDIWTPWRKFIIGDITARIVQFRLKLISNVLNVTPKVNSAKIRTDMPDRLESYNNLIAPVSGLTVNYSPAFKGPGSTPNIQISLENGQSGDYWSFDFRTLDGFKIVFFDKNNNAVSRQFDAHVKGYGRKALSTI